MKKRSRVAALIALGPCCILLAAACGGTDFLDPSEEETEDASPDGQAFADGARPDGASADSSGGVDGAHPQDSSTDGRADDSGDASGFDAAVADAEADADAAIADAAADADAAILDASVDADAAILDASIPDAAIPDASIPDAAILDAGVDADAAAPDAAAANVPNLRSAKDFAVMAGQAVTNSGAGTMIFGDLAVSPGSTLTGLPPGQPNGTIFLGANGVAVQAQKDLTTAYNDLAGRPCPAGNVLTGQDLAGKKLIPGIYCFSSSAALGVGTLTLDAKNDPNAFWVFQIASTLTVSASTVTVINGGTACNVFWQVGSSATIENNAAFAGNIVALSSITLDTLASVSPGRALARNAAVTMLSNQVSKAACP